MSNEKLIVESAINGDYVKTEKLFTEQMASLVARFIKEEKQKVRENFFTEDLGGGSNVLVHKAYPGAISATRSALHQMHGEHNVTDHGVDGHAGGDYHRFSVKGPTGHADSVHKTLQNDSGGLHSAVSVHPLNESKMTPKEKAKAEIIVHGMKKNEDELKDKYGKDWEAVMYATANKKAKE